MKLYHYTSIQTLALILDSRKIRFNRLDNGLDDLEEQDNCHGNINVANKCFISCWTNSSKENIALWKLYTMDGAGVIIGLESNMFDATKDTSSYKFKIQIPKVYSDKIIFPKLIGSGENLRLCQVTYVDDVKTHRKDSIINKGKTKDMDFAKMCATKNKIWEFQEEYRFVLLGLDIDPTKERSSKTVCIDGSGEATDIYGNSLNNIHISLAPNAFEHLSITLGPNCTEGDRLIVEALVERAGLSKNIIRESKLKDKVRW